MEPQDGVNDRKVYSVEELAERLEIGRTLAYQLVKDGSIRSVRVGAKILRIPTSAIDEFLAAR